MNDFPKLLDGFASLLWPIIVIIVIVLFRPAVAAIIESARSRKFTLKIGGQELTMDEVSSQQQNLIADLQGQVLELRRKVEGAGVAAVPGVSRRAPAVETGRTILWVDDEPKNNSYFVQQLSQLGVMVDLALSTSDGIVRFDRGHYSHVISDMGRKENGAYNRTAGIDLLKKIREKDKNIPFVIFCSTRGVRDYGAEADELGATAVTSSPTELFGILNIEGAKLGPNAPEGTIFLGAFEHQGDKPRS